MKTPRRQSRATLQDVALHAGVSVSTASLVLAGKGQERRISEEAEGRVRKAAELLNYAPNLLVRSLRSGRTHVISFYNGFHNRASHDLYMDKLSSAVEYAGGKYGYDILVHCNFDRGEHETYQFLNGGLADGLMMFAPDPDDPLLPLLRRSALPVVFLNARDRDKMFPSVADDGVLGERSIADTLYDLGHRRIVAITGEGPVVRDASHRVSLLRQFLSERGAPIPDENVIDPGGDYTGMLRRLMSEKNPPTAVVCWNDSIVYQVLDSCLELGITVPDQLSVVGYDGIRWASATSHVAASVKVDLELLAERGVRLLDQYIKGYDGQLVEEVLPVSFSPGTTLGPPPGK